MKDRKGQLLLVVGGIHYLLYLRPPALLSCALHIVLFTRRYAKEKDTKATDRQNKQAKQRRSSMTRGRSCYSTAGQEKKQMMSSTCNKGLLRSSVGLVMKRLGVSNTKRRPKHTRTTPWSMAGRPTLASTLTPAASHRLDHLRDSRATTTTTTTTMRRGRGFSTRVDAAVPLSAEVSSKDKGEITPIRVVLLELTHGRTFRVQVIIVSID